MTTHPLGEQPPLMAKAAKLRDDLFRYALSLVRSPEIAEDAVQETYLRFYRTDHEAIADRWVAWMFRVCRTRVIDLQRSVRREISAESTPEEDMVAYDPSPIDQVESRDNKIRLLAMIDSLGPAQREVLRLKFQSDFSYAEIAEITERSVSNVGVLIHNGMMRLREMMNSQTGWDAR